MFQTEPKEAPETWTADCEECNGTGELIDSIDNVIVNIQSCERCEGSGQVEYVPEEDPYAPDNWKDAL